MALVYKITNRLTNKSYIGQTVRTIEQRWSSHISSAKSGSKFRFHSAIRKYGVDSWDFEILFEHDDVNVVKKKEEELIIKFGLIDNKRGYNAKPGGCGGWIVPDDKYDSWVESIRVRSTGLKNGNSINITNEQLVDIGMEISIALGRIPAHRVIVSECEKRGIKFPKSFTKMRFDGDYKKYVAILEEKLGMTYQPHFRTESHRQKLREANLGKPGVNRNTKVILDSEGKRKHVKN